MTSQTRSLISFLIFGVVSLYAVNAPSKDPGCNTCKTCGEDAEGSSTVDSSGGETSINSQAGKMAKSPMKSGTDGVSSEDGDSEKCNPYGPGDIGSAANDAIASSSSARESMSIGASTAGDVADLADPSSLQTEPKSCPVPPDSDSGVVMENDNLRQVVTESAFNDIETLSTGGYSITTWSRDSISLGTPDANGVRPVPTSAFIGRSTYTSNGSGHLQVVREENNGTSQRTTTIVVTQDTVADTKTIETYEGNGTSGTLLRRETLTFTNRDANKIWQLNVDRVIEEVTIDASGTYGSLTTVRRVFEEFIDITPSGEISTGINENRWKRVARRVDGYGTANPRETLFTYDLQSSYQSTGISPYGRLKSVRNPDGSWEMHDYLFAGNVFNQTTYSAYNNVAYGDTTNARKKVTEVAPMSISVTESIAGLIVAKSETDIALDANNSLQTVVRKQWDGSAWFTQTTATHFGETVPVEKSGRTAWVERADGTAATYSYSRNAQSEETTVTMLTGAGDRNGITDGVKTIEVRNQVEKAISLVTKDVATDYEMTRWDAIDYDNLGRPKKIVYNANPADYTITQYGCCGVEYSRDRTGAETTYFRDALKRVYSMSATRSSSGTPVVTNTAFNGLTTTTTRSDGTTTLLISSSTRALNGDMVSSTSPDANGDSTPETTLYAYSYPGDSGHPTGEGVKTDVTMPDLSTSVRNTYLDGRIKSQSGSAVTNAVDNTDPLNPIYLPAMTYTYGTHAQNGGGESTTINYGGTSQSTTSFMDALGRTFSVQYDSGVTSTTTYNGPSAAAGSRGKVASSTDPDTVTTSYTYNTEGERTTTTQQTAGGTRITTTDTDAVDDSISGIGNAWRTVSTVEGTGTGTNAVAPVTVSTSYRSGDGYQSKSVTLSGTSTSTRTVPADGAWTVTTNNPDGTSSLTTYTDGLMASSAAKDSAAATIASSSRTYDAFGRMLTSVDSRTGTSAINGYTESGQPTSVTATDSTTTSFTYDIMGRRIAVDAPNSFDPSGPLNNTDFTNVTYTSYYPTGQVKAVWGAQTYPRFHKYDEQNRLTELRTYQGLAFGTEPDLTTTGFAKTNWVYNTTRGWLDRKEYNDGKGTDYTYTDAGRLATRAWAREVTTGTPVTTTYGYTAAQLTSVSYNDSLTLAVAYTYDSLGRVLNADNTVSSNTYTYNAADLTLTTETVTVAGASSPVAKTITRHYDNLLRPAGMELKDGTTVENAVSYGYDTAGRLQSLDASYPLPTTPDFTYSYQANSYGLVSTVTSPVHTITNTWDNDRNVLLDKKNDSIASTTDPVSQFTYTVNDIGQRTTVDTTGTAYGVDERDRVWSYDKLGQVTAEVDANNNDFDGAYTYDAIGNRISASNYDPVVETPASTTYTANPLNQYSTINLASNPVYDFDGNLKDDAGINNGTNGARTYIWDAENRLIEVKEGTTTIATYAYDYLGRRVRKTVPGTSGEDTVFLYDGWNVITEYNIQNSTPIIQNSYTWGMDLSGSMQGAGGVGGLLAVNDGTDTFYPTYDGNGNVSEYLNSSGVDAAHYEYDAFGNIVKSTGDSEDFRYRFSTKPMDTEIGWYYYGYRYYDPITGRWPSRDPIEEQGGINLYAFVGNDGVNGWDVLGLLITLYEGPAIVVPVDDPDQLLSGLTYIDISLASSPRLGERFKVVSKGSKCWGLSFEGEMKIKIGIFNANDVDDLGRTALEHEREHERLAKTTFNTFAETLNEAEKTLEWCHKPCADAWLKLGKATWNAMIHVIKLEQIAHDWTAYKHRLYKNKPALNDIEARRADAAQKAEQYHQEILSALSEYNAMDCDKKGCE